MSLLGSLITQIARSAADPQDAERHPVGQRTTTRRTGGLGDILGSVLGGSTQQPRTQPQSRQTQQADNGFGLDDILGGLAGAGGARQGGTGGLGDILGSVLGSQRNKGGFGGKGMLIAALLPLVLGWIQRNGGLGAALSKMTNMGYERQAHSWMSNQEQNDNIDPDDISRLFDEQEIRQVAAHTGADTAEVRQGLAELLPEVVNQLTPNGTLDNEAEANQEVDTIINQLSDRLKVLQ
ncbi:YidB family protein [Psychrobacter aestuarii]|uniref:YidB family protein n=1 Tax=Psychrobacter aestuarii TaxID=556327 RepID=A0ABN0VUU8_9GAMM|nr:YidB family protein [Psychrobacter aestuarii]